MSMETRSFSSSLDGGASLVLLRVFSFSRTDTRGGFSGLNVSLEGRSSLGSFIVHPISTTVCAIP